MPIVIIPAAALAAIPAAVKVIFGVVLCGGLVGGLVGAGIKESGIPLSRKARKRFRELRSQGEHEVEYAINADGKLFLDVNLCKKLLSRKDFRKLIGALSASMNPAGMQLEDGTEIKLNLSGHHLGRRNLRKLSATLGPGSCVRELDLSSNDFSFGIGPLVDALSSGSPVRVLNLSKNSLLGPKGVTKILRAAYFCPNLEELHLMDCLGDKGVGTRRTKLEMLDALEALAVGKADLRIIDLSGKFKTSTRKTEYLTGRFNSVSSAWSDRRLRLGKLEFGKLVDPESADMVEESSYGLSEDGGVTHVGAAYELAQPSNSAQPSASSDRAEEEQRDSTRLRHMPA